MRNTLIDTHKNIKSFKLNFEKNTYNNLKKQKIKQSQRTHILT